MLGSNSYIGQSVCLLFGLLTIVTNQNSSWVPYAQKPRPVALTWICDKIGDPAKDATDAPDPASDAPVLLLTRDIAPPFSTPLLHLS